MPITENNFTADELKAALATNKDSLLPIVRGVLGTDFKLIIQDEDEHSAFKQNFESTIASRITKEHAEKLEADVKALTGIDKTENEKYYDYFKRATGQALGELSELKSKRNPSEADKARIQQLEQGLAEKETTYKAQLQEKDKEILNLRLDGDFHAALSKFRGKYKADLPPSVISVIEKAAIEELRKGAKYQEDGKLTFLDAEGKPLVNTSNYQPRTAEELLEEKLKDVIDSGRKAEGSGSNGGSQGSGGSGGSGNAAFTGIPAEVKTRVQLTNHLLKIGIPQGTKEFDEIFTKPEVQKLPLR